MPRFGRGQRAALGVCFFSLAGLLVEAACQCAAPVVSVTCEQVQLGTLGAAPILFDGKLWLATVTGTRMRVTAIEAGAPSSFSEDISAGSEAWRFAGTAVKPGGSAFVLVVQPDCYKDCPAKILELLPHVGRVKEAWGGRLPRFPYALKLLWSTDEPVLVGSDEWLVLRDGALKVLCRHGGGAGSWSGPSGVGVLRTTGVLIVGSSGSSVSWTPPSGSIVTSADYAGFGRVAVIIRNTRRNTESVVFLAEDGRQIGEPQSIGRGQGWSVTSYGEFAVLVREDRLRRLARGTLGPETSLGRSGTLIPVGGWSRDLMVFRGTDELCVVR